MNSNVKDSIYIYIYEFVFSLSIVSRASKCNTLSVVLVYSLD